MTDLADLEKRHAPLIDMKYDTVINNLTQQNYYSTGGDISPGASSPGTEGVLLHLCTHLILYIQARIQLIALYPLQLILVIFKHFENLYFQTL